MHIYEQICINVVELLLAEFHLYLGIGFDDELFIERSYDSLETDTKWGTGDSHLILARLENNSDHYKAACKEFLTIRTKNIEERALVYETLASLNCQDKRSRWLDRSIQLWKSIDVKWRADLLKSIKNNDTHLVFETSKVEPKLDLSNANTITIVPNGSIWSNIRLFLLCFNILHYNCLLLD